MSVTDAQISAANAALHKIDNWTASYNGMRAALTAAASSRPVQDGWREKARDMRNAIDMIEGALMRWPELMDLPEKWGDPRHHRELGLRDIKGNCGQLYDVYDGLAECTRIINSDEYIVSDAAPVPDGRGDIIKQLDAIIYFARKNSEAGPDRETWAEHARKCTEFRDVLSPPTGEGKP